MTDVQHLGSGDKLPPSNHHLLLVRHRQTRSPGDIVITMSGSVACPGHGTTRIAPEPMPDNLYFALAQADRYAARLEVPVIYIQDRT
jgi:hypothetical protein